jgi:hypothetical protein
MGTQFNWAGIFGKQGAPKESREATEAFRGTSEIGKVKKPKQDAQPIDARVIRRSFGWRMCLRSIRGSDLQRNMWKHPAGV